MAQATTSESETRSDRAGKFIDKLKDDGLERVKSTQRTAAGQLEGVAAAIDRASSELGESQPTIAHYVGQLASGIDGFATRIKEGSLDDLVGDAQRFAKSNPTLFVLGSVGVGMLLARFLKASSGQSTASPVETSRTGTDLNARTNASQPFPASVEDSGLYEPEGLSADRFGSDAGLRSATSTSDSATTRPFGSDDGGRDA